MKGYQKYKKTAIESAGREKLLLLLYEGAIRYTKKAIKGVEAGNIAVRAENITRAYDIVMELNNTLDHKVGGDIAANLEQLYMYITDQLSKANLEGSAEPLKVVVKILETLYDGWVQAIDKLKSEQKSG